MRLQLSFSPTSANAPKFAADIVDAAAEISGIKLKYSIDSLKEVEKVIQGFRRDGCVVEQIAETLFGFGCYVGEVLVRNAKGKWRSAKSTPMAELAGFPLVIELGTDNFCNPIGKVFKCFEEGGKDTLSYFYRVFTTEEGAATSAKPASKSKSSKPAAKAKPSNPAAKASSSLPPDILAYHAEQSEANQLICDALSAAINKHLKGAECKIWHRHPVWFLDGNPIVGYSKLKDSVRLLFWSGQSFDESGLAPEGTFKAAEARYSSHDQIKAAALKRWLGKAAKIQWDYKNIVKRKGKLVRLK